MQYYNYNYVIIIEEQIIGLDQVPEISKKMFDRQIKGRYVVEL